MPGCIPADYPITINAVSGYSGGGKAMIQAHEATGGPAFELYGLGLEHKHVPETATVWRADAAADLRAVGGAFPPGHAGFGAAASGHAAGQARPAPICAPRWQAHYAGCDLVRVLPPRPTASWSPRR